MEAVLRLLGASPARRLPPRIESDDVYPVHMLDNSKTLRSIVVTWTLCFNDSLDADNLHASLSKLLEIGDWRKVGGRLRLQVSFLLDACDWRLRDNERQLTRIRSMETWRFMSRDLLQRNVLPYPSLINL
jgi:hypothetical protein